MISASDSTSTVESELTLLVVSNEPERIASAIAGLRHVDEYALVPLDTWSIEDVYLDTAQPAHARQSWSLRVRRINESSYFTIKGPAQRTPWGGVQRVEIEEPWSIHAVSRIRSILRMPCGQEDPDMRDFGNLPPVEALECSGFSVLQRRETTRERRAVLCSAHAEPVAEMVLDRVLYHLGNFEIRHMELEIEATDSTQTAHVKRLSDQLLEAFSPELRRWDYGKLATGRMFQTFLQLGYLQSFVKPDRYLMPTAYEKIDHWKKTVSAHQNLRT